MIESKVLRRDLVMSSLAFLAAIIAATLAIACLFGCATYTAIVEAPTEFWLTAEAIVAALLQDIWAVVDLLL